MRYMLFHVVFGVLFLWLCSLVFGPLEFDSLVYGFFFFSLNYLFLYLVFSRVFRLAAQQSEGGESFRPKRLGLLIFFAAFKFVFLGAGVYFGLSYFALDGIYLVAGALAGLLLAALAGGVFSGSLSFSRLFGIS